jgi:hypothetical protein
MCEIARTFQAWKRRNPQAARIPACPFNGNHAIARLPEFSLMHGYVDGFHSALQTSQTHVERDIVLAAREFYQLMAVMLFDGVETKSFSEFIDRVDVITPLCTFCTRIIGKEELAGLAYRKLSSDPAAAFPIGNRRRDSIPANATDRIPE